MAARMPTIIVPIVSSIPNHGKQAGDLRVPEKFTNNKPHNGDGNSSYKALGTVREHQHTPPQRVPS